MKQNFKKVQGNKYYLTKPIFGTGKTRCYRRMALEVHVAGCMF